MDRLDTHHAAPARAPAASPSAPGADVRARHRYGVLLACCLLLLAVQGTVPEGPVQEVVVAALCGTSLVLAVRAADLTPRLRRAAALLAGIVLVASVVRATTGEIGDGVSRLLNASLVAFGPPAVALGVVRDLRASGRVRIESVAGVLALYMLLGMLFAFVYGAIDRLGGGDFFAGGDPATVSTCLYFSFVTLATVGYGDLVAASDLGRTLAIFEALIGQIYLVTVVSLIVSNLGRPTPTQRPGPPR